jgi:hypothetical protein
LLSSGWDPTDDKRGRAENSFPAFDPVGPGSLAGTAIWLLISQLICWADDDGMTWYGLTILEEFIRV